MTSVFTLTHQIPDEDVGVNLEEHCDEICKIRVAQRAGYNCSVSAEGSIPLSAKHVWEILCHPDNVNIFRHMDRCTYRKILSTSADGTRRSLEVENEAEWRFLVFSGRFNTRIKVQEDHRGLIMQFELLPSQSMLKKFNGSWTVQPDPENPETWSISTIEHDLSIKWHMPPPFDRVLKRMACQQLQEIFEDLLAEAERIATGAGPTLCAYADVANKEVGTD